MSVVRSASAGGVSGSGQWGLCPHKLAISRVELWAADGGKAVDNLRPVCEYVINICVEGCSYQSWAWPRIYRMRS